MPNKVLFHSIYIYNMSLLIHTDCTGKLLPIMLFWKCILMNKSDYINYTLRNSGLVRFSGYDLFQ